MTGLGGDSLFGRAVSAVYRTETGAGAALLLLLMTLPLAEITVRGLAGSGIPAQADYLRLLVVWIGCVGAMLASRMGCHPAGGMFASTRDNPRVIMRTLAGLASAAVCGMLASAAVQFVALGFEDGRTIGIFPLKAALGVIPLGFAVMAIRSATGVPTLAGKIVAASGLFASIVPWIPFDSAFSAPSFRIALPVALVIGCAAAGMPFFAALGGIAIVLFSGGGVASTIVVNQIYTAFTGALMPALPLFTFAGFALSESGARGRLVRLFEAWLGPVPGGGVVAVVSVSAFFTSFTGATGITILALGGVLASLLSKSRSPREYDIGLVTASSSLGILFIPSLPVIIYGSIAHINIRDLFAAGLAPGLLLLGLTAALALTIDRRGRKSNARPRRPFDLDVALRAAKEAWWEALLPAVITTAFFSGFATLIECGALACLWVLFGGMVLHRDIGFRSLPAIAAKSLPAAGSVLILLGTASALSYYLVDAEIPSRLAGWMRSAIESKFLFLLLLNAGLLAAGCVMDIYSALIVVAPLVIPMGAAFGIDPLHLGVIFLANLGIGFLTPPVGLSLLLASVRFEVPLGRMVRIIAPYFLVLFAGVLLITYAPVLSLWLAPGP